MQKKIPAIYSCPVVKPVDFGLPNGFGRIEFIARYLTIIFHEADLTEALEAREIEINRLRRKNEKLLRMMNQMHAAQAQLQPQASQVSRPAKHKRSCSL
ncbi:hypothetical protein SESBI_05590 [Sesbania bispinosa]|nr:hypothetical protein SESBI_05590 [Sesbania bispinosa]